MLLRPGLRFERSLIVRSVPDLARQAGVEMLWDRELGHPLSVPYGDATRCR